MPYCTNCGEEVTEQQRYCSYCGERIDEEPPQGGGRRGDEDTGGFEGDPPPKGYEDPPSVRDSLPANGVSRERATTHFLASFRRIFRLPISFLGLFSAWFVTSSLLLVESPLALVGVLLSGLVGLFAAGTLYVYADRDLRGETATIGDVTSSVLGQFLPLFAIWLLFVPVFVFGLALFVLPGLYVGGRLSLAFPACVLDRRGVLGSLSTSWNLTRDVSLTSMGILGLGLLSFFVLSFLLAIPQNVVFAAMGVEMAEFSTIEETLELFEDPQFALISSVFQALALAISTGAVQIAAARLYLQER